ncbi:MFS transporter [Candidatus Gracilibacteria bacterium]|nr:MFS transporter [Candidatus Gracilibacteria bacterium]
MKKNIYLFYSISFLETFVFTTAIWAFFFTSYLNFSFGQALFLITLSGITATIFEVPSGVWADRFGRKKLYILGTILLILNLVFWALSTSFCCFIIAGIINGIGGAIISGNLEALVHDNLEEEGNEKEFRDIGSNSYISVFLGRAISASVSGFLFVVNPLLPVYFTLFSKIIILILTIFLKEPTQILSVHKNDFLHLKETFNFLLKHKFIFNFMLILGLLSGIGNVYFFTQQPYFRQLGFSIEFIGIIFTIGALFSALGSYLFKKISNYFNDKQILNIMLLMVFFVSVLFSLFQREFALVAVIIVSIMFGFVMTFGNNFLIHKVPKNQKSTILSTFSFFIIICYSFFNIILSLIIGKVGLVNIYFVNIALIIFLIIFNLWTFNRQEIGMLK